MRRAVRFILSVCLLTGAACSVEQVKASSTVSVTLRAGDAGTINQSAAQKMIKDDGAVEVTSKYVRVTVDKENADSVESVLYQGFGISDPDLLMGTITEHEGHVLLPSDTWGVESGKQLRHNEEYVLDYGVLVDPVMYTIQYVDVESYDAQSGTYLTQLSAPYINYGNAGEVISVDSAVLSEYATTEENCSFTLEKGKENGYTFYYAYVGPTETQTTITYDTQYVNLTPNATNAINNAAAGNPVGVTDDGAQVPTPDDITTIEDGDVPLDANEDEDDSLTNIEDEDVPLADGTDDAKGILEGNTAAVLFGAFATVVIVGIVAIVSLRFARERKNRSK